MDIQATYSPEDNKIRLYPSRRLDAETFARVKSEGFKWAPRQELFVAPKWTPSREDLALELAGDIEPEEMTLAERAEAKAERLEELSAKRARDANAYSRRAAEISERFAFGQPILVGHHSERKARKDQERMDSAQRKAGEAHRLANYWLYRASGVERFANMKNAPRVRANRIKTLLADLRDHQRTINEAHRGLAIWEKLDTAEKLRVALYRIDCAALGLPWRDAPEDFEELRALGRKNLQARLDSQSRRRWIDHILQRLGFERSMLGPVERFEGELTPAILQTFARTMGADKPKAEPIEDRWQLSSPVPLPLHMGDGDSLELTPDEWRDMMQELGYEVPDAKPSLPPILNLDVALHQSASPYHRGQVDNFVCVRTDKATYSKIRSEQRGTRTSLCGRYRFKVCPMRSLKPDSDDRWGWAAVFLTDSKKHELAPLADQVELAL